MFKKLDKMLERYDRKFSIMPSVYPLCEILPIKNKNAVKNIENIDV